MSGFILQAEVATLSKVFQCRKQGTKPDILSLVGVQPYTKVEPEYVSLTFEHSSFPLQMGSNEEITPEVINKMYDILRTVRHDIEVLHLRIIFVPSLMYLLYLFA